jgi:hypothetical protein
MKTLLLLPLFFIFVSPGQNPTASQESSSVTVLGFKWSQFHKKGKDPDPAQTSPPTPQREMIPANKVWQREARVNDPMGAKDPNEDTIDTRSAALERIVQQARTPSGKSVDVFEYLVKVKNASKNTIAILFLEYQFIDPSNPGNVSRRQFLCGVNIKPKNDKELEAFSLSGPSDVIRADSIANRPGNTLQEKVVINRVEYEDGSTWTRKDWNAAEIKLTYQHAVATPWNPGEMCRGL